MIRRCPAPLTMMVAALAISLGSRPMSTQADAISTTTYELTNTTAIPPASSNTLSVEAVVSPTGGVVTLPAVNNVVPNPLTVVSLPAGLNADELVDGLKNGTGANNVPEQLFGLEFGQGLPANSVFTFTLTTNGSLSTAPQLVSQTPGVTINIVSYAPPSSTASPDAGGGGSGGGPTGPNVPEPLSLLIWSALACAGLWRVRAQRRSQPVAL